MPEEKPLSTSTAMKSIAIGIVGSLLLLGLMRFQMDTGEAPLAETPRTEVPATNISPETLTLSADAAYVLDLNTNRVLYEHNAEVQLPLASLTKIMTVITALSIADPASSIAIDPESLETEGDSGLYAYESIQLSDLAALTLVSSSNDGAAAISRNLTGDPESFVAMMNTVASQLSLTQTYFLNPSGLDMSLEGSGAYGSARDVARMLSYGVDVYPEMFLTTTETDYSFVSESTLVHNASNTNQNVDEQPGLLASKTGFTDLAGGNLAIVFDAAIDRPVAVVVLGSTREDRFTDVAKLADYSSRILSQ